jgi:hypothetical protein
MPVISTLNFGGINDSPTEFYDASNNSTKEYFDAVNVEYNRLMNTPWGTLRSVFYRYFDDKEYVEQMFEDVNTWFMTCISEELLIKLNCPSELFDIGSCSVSEIFKNILTKDKGISGFEQINSNRASNVPKNFKNFMNSDRTLNINKFKEALEVVYIHVAPERVTRSQSDNTQNIGIFKTPNVDFDKKHYADYFMKGRKEGANKATKNYYKDNHEDEINEQNFEQLFSSVGKTILSLFDILTFQMANVLPLPVEFDNRDQIIDTKIDFMRNYISSYEPDILFITEYSPGIFGLERDCSDVSEEHLLYGYTMICGPVTDGLCNAIIYKNNFGIFEEVEYPIHNDTEYKEFPLVLENNSRYTPVTLICYHAGGRGLLEKVDNLIDTNLYDYVNTLDSQVIVGGDFNCSLADSCGEVDSSITMMPTFEQLNTNIKYSTYKERTPLQAQFDKTGKRDSKVKDGFIFKNINVRDPGNVQVFSQDDNSLVLHNVPDVPNDDVLLPNGNHPFDHFLVSCTIDEPHWYARGFWKALECFIPSTWLA